MANSQPRASEASSGRQAKTVRSYDAAAAWGLGIAIAALVGDAFWSTVSWAKLPFTKLTWSPSPTQHWLILAGLTAVILWLAGYKANGKWFGVLIDERRRTSLSRLQIGMWTVLAMSAFLAVALARSKPAALIKPTAEAVAACKAALTEDQKNQADEFCSSEPDPLRIIFPNELLVALGISTLSFAGASLVKTNKRSKRALVLISDLEKRKESAAAEHTKARAAFEAADAQYKSKFAEYLAKNPGHTQTQAEQTDVEVEALGATREAAKKKLETAETAKEAAAEEAELAQAKVGILKINKSVDEATLGDMFQGNEVGNYNLIDLSKVQMFLFTIAIGVAYSAALVGLFQGNILNPFGVELPEFSNSLNVLLGISHAGYIATQSVDHSQAIE